MSRFKPCVAAALTLTASFTLLSCGGGDGGSLGSSQPAPASNVLSVIVDEGPSGNSVNTLFTTVTVCVPGTTTCQTIDHIQVDTGSFGLRILAPALTLALPLQTANNGGTLVECTNFVDGYSWGPVATADVQLSGETASALPVQIIGDSRFTTVPADCSNGGTAEDTVATFGANGILGIGVFAQDCGIGCVNPVEPISGADSYPYYSCTGAACMTSPATLAQQVPNPIAEFAVDNNGSYIQLPTVPPGGATTVTGSVIFGIDTQTNNASGTQTVVAVNDSAEFTATFEGQPLSDSFIDSGSNGLYFNVTDNSITPCPADSQISEFYCPANTVNLTAAVTAANGSTQTINFSVGDAQTILTDASNFNALPLLAGINPDAQSFDFGLAFFYGRRVAAALEGKATSAGTGPYVAF